MSIFDYKVLNNLVSYGHIKLHRDTGDIALAYVEKVKYM